MFGCERSDRSGLGCFVTSGPEGSGVKQFHVTSSRRGGWRLIATRDELKLCASIFAVKTYRKNNLSLAGASLSPERVKRIHRHRATSCYETGCHADKQNHRQDCSKSRKVGS